jgi:hypothetical protein
MNVEEYSKIHQNWFFDVQYPNYKKFLDLFDIDKRPSYKYKLPTGSLDADSYSDADFAYPHDIDQGEYAKFITDTVQEQFPIKDVKLLRTWWVHYPAFKNTFVGVHRHESPNVFTTVLFLEGHVSGNHMLEPGTLFAIVADGQKTKMEQWEPVPGTVVLMDGMVYHGTYPTQFDRKVLVCDFEYNIGENNESR